MVKWNHIEYDQTKLSVFCSRLSLSGGLLSTGFNSIMIRSSFSQIKFHSLHSLAKRELTGEYIAGLVQADGSFSAVLGRKLRGDKEYFNLSLVFTLVQNIEYKDLILEIQKKWGNIGNWYLSKKDNTIRYQVTKQSDLLNVVIPFFMKYQLRSGKLVSFLHFKYITEMMSSKVHVNNRKILLSLIVIASNMNPLGKLGNKIRYLKPEEQKYVINNIQPEGGDISKLKDSIQNFPKNPLTLDFIQGLFDGDGNLTVYLVGINAENTSEGKNYKVTLRSAYTIVQDVHNLSLLDEIKSYFNNLGGIYKLNEKCSIYKVGSVSELISTVLPKMANKESIELVKDSYEGLPFMKHNKIYYTCKILELLSKEAGLLNEESFNKLMGYTYYVIRNSEKMTLKQFIESIKNKHLI